MNHVGIDIGKRKCIVCIMNDKQKILKEFAYDNTEKDAHAVAQKVAKMRGSSQALCESTGNMWLKTFKAFEDNNIPIILANTMKMKIISETDNKTDKNDAHRLANALRAGIVPECYVAPPEVREVRGLLRHRINLVQDRTRVINRIHNLLDKYDVTIYASTMYSKKAISKMIWTKLPSTTDTLILRDLAQSVDQLTQKISKMENEINKHAATSDDAMLLMSMTGLDSFGAMLLTTEIGAYKRFATAEKLVAWAGLCPRVYQSGNSIRHGRMRKACNNNSKWIMMGAASTAVRHDERMKEFYQSVCKRHPPKVALAHVAQKMMRIVWHMLYTRTKYQNTNEDLYKRKIARLKLCEQ